MIIPAAGLGTRMRSINPLLAKEMLPIGSQPAIYYALAEGVDAGVDEILVILSPAKAHLKQYLDNLDLPIRIAYQPIPTGEADAILLVEKLVTGDSIVIVYPDNLHVPSPGFAKPLFSTFEHYGIDTLGLSSVTAENETAIGNAGQVALQRLTEDVFRIKRLETKSRGHFHRRFDGELRACGIMATGPHIFDAIHGSRPQPLKGEHTDETVRQALLLGGGLLGLRLPGTVFDIGNPAGYRSCIADLTDK